MANSADASTRGRHESVSLHVTLADEKDTAVIVLRYVHHSLSTCLQMHPSFDFEAEQN
jgi:hypothetical protein